MDKKATLSDIMNIARSNEEKGAWFYARMAERAGSENIKNVFEKLSREELEHKAAFEKMLKIEVRAGEEIGAEEGKLLQSLISTSVFYRMTEESREVLSPAEALAIGVQAEKDSILLYQSIFNQSKSQTVRNMLSILLEEEKRHLVELREHMEEMQQI
ncbi:MAG: ferritin family protein [Actinobacteria bacterium]|nr:ferritin family protein [Actinomycetota bacterium]